MIFITPATLTQAIKYYSNILQAIANNLLIPTNPDFDDRKKEFMEAADKYDSEKINELIVDAINNYCSSTDAAKGLEEWCAKFDIKPDYPLMGAFDWIRLIARNENKIDSILSQKRI